MSHQILVGQRAAIFGLLLAGLSTEKIGHILGWDAQRVRRLVPPDWMPPRGSGRKPKVRERQPGKPRINPDAVVSYFQAGHYTLQEVGDAFGVTRERVRQILAKRGISERRLGTLPREILEDRYQRYLAALKPGVSTKEAAAISGVTYQEASNASRALGLAMPRPVRKSRLKYAEVAAFYEGNPHLTGNAVAEHFGCTPKTVSRALQVMNVKPRHSGWTHAHHSNSARGMLAAGPKATP